MRRTLRSKSGDGSAGATPLASTDTAMPFELWSGSDSQTHELAFGGTLGAGGMGVVRAALQLPLERQVAVKHVGKGADRDEAIAALLREALVASMIEHPNTVPIYGIARDDHGSPVLVMKRIAGRPWREAIAVPFDGESLERHLEVLMQICQVVHYAHSLGVVHRDLKLDNVMIGEFGEVYLIDWGLAVSVREEHGGRLPLAREAHAGAGTPLYMAPEMVAGDGLVDERTDVYLLGAMLHEILTGAGRHIHPTKEGTLREAMLSRPHDYDERVPAELGAVCNRAMSRWPDDRYPSAEALRDALALFLRHRSSATLAEEAASRLSRLDVDEADDRQGIAVEARFGFEQALKTWPENPIARRGLQRVLEWMVEDALEHGHGDVAERLLGELPEVPPGYRARLDALRARRREEERSVGELARLRSEFNFHVGARSRARNFMGLGVFVAAVAVLLNELGDRGFLPKGYPLLLAGCIVAAASTALTRWWLARRINAAARGAVDSLIIFALASAAMVVAAEVAAVDPRQVLGLVLLQAATIGAILGRIALRAAYFSAAICAVAAVGVLAFPDRDAEIFALGFLFGAIPYARGLRKRAEVEPTAVSSLASEGTAQAPEHPAADRAN